MAVFTFVPDASIQVGAPVSNQLMTWMRDNDNYLFDTISAGAAAPQGLDISSLTISGNLLCFGTLNVAIANITSPSGTLTWTGDTVFDGGAQFLGNLSFAAVDLGLLQAKNFMWGF